MTFKLCPYCGEKSPVTPQTQRAYLVPPTSSDDQFTILIHTCFFCEQKFAKISGKGRFNQSLRLLHPAAPQHLLPTSVPAPIHADFKEARAVLHLSPRASAVLARRCLQEMLRDVWDTHHFAIAKEISAAKARIVEESGSDDALFSAMDVIRQKAGDAAHPEKDIFDIKKITVSDAQAILDAIVEIAKDWYVDRAERQAKYLRVAALIPQELLAGALGTGLNPDTSSETLSL